MDPRMLVEAFLAGEGQSRFSPPLPVCGEYPAHVRTGRRGYLGNRGSLLLRAQSMNAEPLLDSMRRACWQSPHNPSLILSLPPDSFT